MINELEKQLSDSNHKLKIVEETLANGKNVFKKETQRLREKVENYKRKVKTANQRMLLLKKNLIGTEVQKIVDADVTQGLHFDTNKKNKIKDAFRDAGFWL